MTTPTPEPAADRSPVDRPSGDRPSVDAMFTEAEVAYLRSQRIVRLATARADGSRVDVAPLGVTFDGHELRMSGYDLPRTMKWFHVRENPNVALVWDDLVSTDPWVVRGLKVHGDARVETAADGRDQIVVVPTRKWSWGINGPAFDRTGPVTDRAERSS